MRETSEASYAKSSIGSVYTSLAFGRVKLQTIPVPAAWPFDETLGIEPPERAQYIRVMFDEITRVLNHLMWLGAHGLDIGAMTVFLLCFKEREELMDVYEAVSGTRMHATYYRPGGVYRDLPEAMPRYQASKWRSVASSLYTGATTLSRLSVR